MAVLNNVNVGMLAQVTREAKNDKSKVKRTQINGEWLLAEGVPQCKAEINFENSKVVMESDQPKSLGGYGSQPGPLHYCFFGLVSCYTATLSTAILESVLQHWRVLTSYLNRRHLMSHRCPAILLSELRQVRSRLPI